MKLLVAADGTSTESSVSRKFGHALFLLEVVAETDEVYCMAQSPARDRREIIAQAAERGITTMIAGAIELHALPLLTAHRMSAACAPGLSVRTAARRLLKGELTILTPQAMRDTLQKLSLIRTQRRQELGRTHLHHMEHQGAMLPTPRGRHHLQQFAGRGH